MPLAPELLVFKYRSGTGGELYASRENSISSANQYLLGVVTFVLPLGHVVDPTGIGIGYYLGFSIGPMGLVPAENKQLLELGVVPSLGAIDCSVAVKPLVSFLFEDRHEWQALAVPPVVAPVHLSVDEISKMPDILLGELEIQPNPPAIRSGVHQPGFLERACECNWHVPAANVGPPDELLPQGPF